MVFTVVLRIVCLCHTILVSPNNIQFSMYGFAAIVLVAAIAGAVMMKLQKELKREQTVEEILI